MARDLEAALAPSLNAGPVPDSGPALVDYAGGRAALVRQLTGMDHAPRAREYPDAEAFEAARHRWRTAQRNAQRWDKGRKPEPLPPATKGKLRRDANRRRRDLLARRGLRARMKVRLRVPSPNSRRGDDVRTRELPVWPAPAVFIDGEIVGEILEELGEDQDAAAEDFLDAFMDAYGMPEDLAVEIEAVEWLRVWPEGSTEPRED